MYCENLTATKFSHSYASSEHVTHLGGIMVLMIYLLKAVSKSKWLLFYAK